MDNDNQPIEWPPPRVVQMEQFKPEWGSSSAIEEGYPYSDMAGGNGARYVPVITTTGTSVPAIQARRQVIAPTTQPTTNELEGQLELLRQEFINARNRQMGNIPAQQLSPDNTNQRQSKVSIPLEKEKLELVLRLPELIKCQYCNTMVNPTIMKVMGKENEFTISCVCHGCVRTFQLNFALEVGDLTPEGEEPLRKIDLA